MHFVLVISGSLVADFQPVDPDAADKYYGIVLVQPDIYYEVTLIEVPEGAETLLLEGEAITLRGRLQGN